MCLGSVHVSPSIETFSAPDLHIHCVCWTCWGNIHIYGTCVPTEHESCLCTTYYWPLHISIYLYLLVTPYLLYAHICCRHAQVLYMHIHCSCDPCTNTSYYIHSYCKHTCRLCTYIATVNSCSFTAYAPTVYTDLLFIKCRCACCRHIHKHSRYLLYV